MIDEKYLLLIQRRFHNKLSDADQLDLESWLDQSPEHRQVLQDMEKTWQLASTYQANYTPDVESGLQALKNRIQVDKTAVSVAPKTKFRSLSFAYSIAAGVLILIAAFAVWNFWLRPAVVTTALLEQKTVTLPDGSTVVLNQNSRLTYPRFFREDRQIQLSGEAYFDIVRDEQHPFIINTSKAKTEVLGTSFNVRAYDFEPFTEVEVIKGMVRLIPAMEGKQPIQLTEGARGTYRYSADAIIEDHPKTLNSIYWKERRFRFKEHNLREALAEINKRLNIQIQLADTTLNTCSITQSIPFETPANLVEIIADVFGSQWKETEKDKFLIIGGSCQ